MGRGRRARQRRSRKQRRAASAGRLRRLEISIDQFEVARAYDGPLRGRIEPRILLGAFHVRVGRAVLLGRALAAFTAPRQVPFQLVIERELIRASILQAGSSAGTGLIVLLALAIEEDSGKDVQRLYAELEHPERWTVWQTSSVVPEPRLLGDLPAPEANQEPAAESVQLLSGEATPVVLQGDDFVDAVLVRITDELSPRSDWRFHFCSADGRNDWTAILRVRVSGASA